MGEVQDMTRYRCILCIRWSRDYIDNINQRFVRRLTQVLEVALPQSCGFVSRLRFALCGPGHFVEDSGAGI